MTAGRNTFCRPSWTSPRRPTPAGGAERASVPSFPPLPRTPRLEPPSRTTAGAAPALTGSAMINGVPFA